MNKPLPWNVKGVGFDAREAARIAAKRAGVPLGEWLNGVISARAAELGVKVDDVEADDRLEAIAARLSVDGNEGFPESRGQADDAGHAVGLDAMGGTVRELARLQADRGSTLPTRGDARQPLFTRFARAAQPRPADPELPDGTSVEAAEAAAPIATAAVEPTATAIAPRETQVAQAAQAAQEASPRAVEPGTTARTAAQFEAAQLDARLASILKKLNTSQTGADTSAMSADVRDEAPGPAGPTAEAVPAEAPPLRDGAKVAGDAVRQTRSADKRPGESFTDLHAAFKDLASKLDGQAPVPQAADARAAATDLAAELAVLGDRVSRLRGPGPERTEKGQPQDTRTLRNEAAQLSADLSQLAPQQSLASLESAVRELAGRVDLSRLDGVQASVLAPVERLSREMREAIRAADVTPAMQALRRDIAAVATKVDGAQREADPKAFEALRNEMREMRSAIGALTERLGAAERLQGEVVALGDRVSALADRTSPTVARDLGAAVGDIRDLLRTFAEDGIGTLDRKIDTLSTRMATLAGSREPTGALDDLARRIDRAHDGLVERLAPLSATASGLSALHDRISALSGKVDGLSRSSQDVQTLYSLVGSLADRLEEARSPQAGSDTLNALQAQIGTLVERLDKTTATDATLQGLERLIGDLFLQIEQSRNTAIDAAENAARAAAQDTLRAAMDNPALNGAELTVQTGLDVDHVSQELAELRRVQETSDRRVNATLTALNTTLERLVDRLVSEGSSKPEEAKEPAGQTGRRRGRASPEPSVSDRGPKADLPIFDPEQFLLEPGSGEARGRARSGEAFDPAVIGSLHPDASDPATDVAPLIAAARRAAQAAQASALEASLKVDAPADAAGRAGKTRSFFASKRRALLLSLAGVVLLAGTLQVIRLSTDRDGDGATASAEPAADATAMEPKAAAPATPAPNAASVATPDQVPSAPVAPPAPAGPTPGTGASLLAPPASADKPATGFTASTSAPAPAAQPTSLDVALNGLSPGLKDLATSGSAAAQYEVAARLSDGRGVSRDAKQAVVWFQRSAQQGFAPAQYRLGSLYEKGVGVTADPALAVAWYEKAAGQGNVRAMHNLAVMSAEGTGGKPDYGKAVTWFTKAASYGVRDSQFNLAVLFARGLGVPQSFGQSYAWFAVAAQQGDGDAVAKRDAVAGKLDAKALADAKATVASFRPLTPEPTANDVAAPSGGWDAAASAKATGRKSEARLSSM